MSDRAAAAIRYAVVEWRTAWLRREAQADFEREFGL